MKVYILRHGETDWNVRHLFQGQTNTSLNINGFREAEACRERVRKLGLSFDRVYSSPLNRAMETVETVTGLSGDRIIQDDRLMEMNFGPVDGTPFDKSSTQAGNLFTDPAHYVPPEGGETFAHLLARLSGFFEDLKRAPGQSILVGSHGAAMRGMLVVLHYNTMDRFWDVAIGNCTIIEAELGADDQFHVVRFYRTEDPFITRAKEEQKEQQKAGDQST